MESHLTEISNSYLFSEYLSCLGVTPKDQRKLGATRGNRVVALIKMKPVVKPAAYRRFSTLPPDKGLSTSDIQVGLRAKTRKKKKAPISYRGLSLVGCLRSSVHFR